MDSKRNTFCLAVIPGMALNRFTSSRRGLGTYRPGFSRMTTSISRPPTSYRLPKRTHTTSSDCSLLLMLSPTTPESQAPEEALFKGLLGSEPDQ